MGKNQKSSPSHSRCSAQSINLSSLSLPFLTAAATHLWRFWKFQAICMRHRNTDKEMTNSTIKDEGGCELLTLPPEVLILIGSFLDIKSVLNLSSASVAWRNLLYDEHLLWKALYHRHWLSSCKWRDWRSGETCESWMESFKQRTEIENRWLHCKPNVATLHGHEEEVYCLQFDEDRIVSGSYDKTIRVWDLDKFREGKKPTTISKLVGHREFVGTLRIDSKNVVSGSADNTMRVWDLETEKCTDMIEGHVDEVVCLRFSEQYIVSGSKDNTIKVWDRRTKQCINTLEGHTQEVCGLHFDAANYRLFSGSWDHTIKLWDLRKAKPVHVFTGHTDGLWTLQYENERDILISGSRDTTVKVWNMKNFTCEQTLTGHTGRVLCLQFEGNKLVTGAGDFLIKVWNLKTNQCVSTLDYHSSRVWCLQFDSTKIISGSNDRTIRIHDFSLPEEEPEEEAVVC